MAPFTQPRRRDAEKGAESRWHGGCPNSSRSRPPGRGAVGGTGRDARDRSLGRVFRTRSARHTSRASRSTSPCAQFMAWGRCDPRRRFAPCSTLFRAASRAGFRVLHFSVQTDHVHLIVEADSKDDLRRGLNRLNCRVARALNRAWSRRGQVWADRYHARALATPREVRNGIAYVLLNFRKHLGAPPVIDPRSSGLWFDGWTHSPQQPPLPPPTAVARTWLGATGWRRAGGLVGPREKPAANSGPSRPRLTDRRRDREGDGKDAPRARDVAAR